MTNTLKRHRRVFLPAILLTVLAPAMLVLLVQLGIVGQALAQTEVDVSILDPATGLSTVTVDSGDNFSMIVRVDAAADRQVNGTGIFVNFDPAVLTVDGGAAGITVSLPGSFIVIAAPTVDNASGEIGVAVGTLQSLDPFGAPFDVITIDFQALKTSDGTTVSFETVDALRETNVTFFNPVTETVDTETGTLSPATVTVIEAVGPTVDQWNAQLAFAADISGTVLTTSGVDLDFGLHPDALAGVDGFDTAFSLGSEQLVHFFLIPPFTQQIKSKIPPTPPLEWTLSIEAKTPFVIPFPLVANVTITPSLTEVPEDFVVNLLDFGTRAVLATFADGVGVVRTIDIAPSATSGTAFFIIEVVPPVPLPAGPALSSPANGASTSNNLPLFQWGTGTDVFDSYRLQVGSGDLDTGPLAIDEVIAAPGTEFQTTTPLPDNTYQWRVRTETSGAAASDYSDPLFVFTLDTSPPGAPVPLSPLGSTNDNTPLFNWDAPVANGVADYRLQVVTFPSPFAEPFDIDIPGITQTNFQTTVPLVDGVYQWRVIARDAAENTAASSPEFLIVDTLPPAPAPTLLSPGDGGSVGNLPFFEWTVASGDVADYLLQVTSGDFITGPLAINAGGITDTQFQATSPLAEDAYSWRVIASDAAQNAATSDTSSFTVDTTDPSLPVLIFPLGGVILGNRTVSFAWTPSGSSDVVAQILKVTTGDDPLGLRFITQDLSPAAATFEATMPKDGRFRWLVAAEDGAGNLGFSTVGEFIVDTVPPSPAPILVFPESGDSINNSTPFFAWTPSSGDVFGYLLQVTSGDTFNPHVDLEEFILHPGTGHQATTPLADARYIWRVIATDDAANEAPSATRGFTVDITLPSPPTLLSPIGPIADETPFFTWDGSTTGDDSGYLLAVTSGDLDTAFLNLFGGPQFDPFQFPPGDPPPGFDIFQPIAGDPLGPAGQLLPDTVCRSPGRRELRLACDSCRQGDEHRLFNNRNFQGRYPDRCPGAGRTDRYYWHSKAKVRVGP